MWAYTDLRAQAVMKKFPFQQGDLDDFCSIYALINLIAARQGGMDAVDAQRLFVRMINRVHHHGNLRLTTIDGIDPDEIEWLGKAVKVPLESFSIPSVKQVTAAAKKYAIIFCTFNFDNIDPTDPRTHYTVIKSNSVTAAFELYDSYGYKTVSIKNGEWFLDKEQITVNAVFW